MNFDLSEDERALRDVAERFVRDRYDLERRRAYLAQPAGFSAENWRLLGELGLIAAAFPAEAGGLGSSAGELAVLCEALGRGLVIEPLIEGAVFAGGLFAAAAPPALAAEWLPALVAGERRLAVAQRDGGAPVRAARDGAGWRLTGEKALVPGAVGADGLIVTAAGEDGPELFLVTPGSARVAPHRLIDGSLAATVTLDAAVGPEARLDAAAFAAARARADLAHAAEALGLMQLLFELTLDHLRTRRQFGQPLASFQALQHRMVAQYVALESARGLVQRAAATGTAAAVAGARAFVAGASVELGHEAIQLHGGMGVSDELAVGHAHKRLFLLSRHPDGAAEALARYAGHRV